MPAFKPNDLQRALFIEVMNATMSNSGDDLVDREGVAHAWLTHMKPVLVALAGIGRAAVRGGRSTRDTMLMDCMRAMSGLPHDTLRWLGDWECLSGLISPDALRTTDETTCRANFQQLATLDEGL
jgi:hypothetical protein